MLGRLRENLIKTRQALRAELAASLFDLSDGASWERLEEALIKADLGAPLTARVVGQLEDEVARGELSVGEPVRQRLVELLGELGTHTGGELVLAAKPTVILVVGVNGTGKTTTVGKLAWYLSERLGLEVVLGAGDTFRAAGVEQLEQWAKRAGVEIVTGKQDADPASVAFETVSLAVAKGADVALIDTAGRLHTYDNLMAELEKISRVTKKQLQDAPHETLLVIDATTGQNGLAQAKVFSQAVNVTGVVLSKLDGSAKCGVALAIASELDIPVKLVGVGEQIEDLKIFDAREFASALIS